MKGDSYAGGGAGIEDADDIRVHRVTGEDCPKERCQYEDVHIVIEWRGDSYDSRNSWVSFKESGVVSLSKCE